MDQEDSLILTSPEFDALMAKLEVLSRNHLLFFRLEVGRVVSQELFGGDPKAYHDTAANKQSSLQRFAAERKAELADLGLTEVTLRQSVLAWFVVEALPAELVEKLRFTHVVELARVEDRGTRLVLAQAIVDNGWGGDALKQAVLAVRAGRWIDGDAAQPGLQPPDPEPEPRKAPHPGRLVTRIEKAVGDLDVLLDQWEEAATEKLTKKQQARAAGAIAEIKERLARLEAKVTR